MKKYSLIVLLFIFPMLAYSQNPEDFKVVLTKHIVSSLPRYLCVGNHHLFISAEIGTVDDPIDNIMPRLITVDSSYNFKRYDTNATKIFEHPSKWQDIRYIKKYKDNIFWFTTIYGGFVVFREEKDTLLFLHNYSSDNIKNLTRYETGSDKDLILDYCFDNEGEYVYYIAAGMDLRRMKVKNPDSAEQLLNLVAMNADLIYPPHNIFIDENDILWFTGGYTPAFVAYNTKTGEVTIHDTNTVDKHGNRLFQRFYEPDLLEDYIMRPTSIISLSEKYNYAKLAIASTTVSADTTYAPYKNKFFMYENGEWDTIPLPENLLIAHPRMAADYIFQWSEDEVAIYFNNTATASDMDGIFSVYYLIYNLITKEWRKFELPRYEYNGKYVSYTIEPIPVFWQGKWHFAINFPPIDSELNGLVVYDPDNSIPEPAIIKNYSLFPNPASDDCTLSMDMTEAGSINISLSDMLGRDIMQIYDGYADAGAFSKAFNTKHLASGVYSVIIRIGDKAKAEKLIINK